MGILLGSDNRPIYSSNGLPIYAPDPVAPLRNFGAMQTRIADEMITDPVTASHITQAIQDAIRDYARTKFWFNAMYDQQNFEATQGKEFYSPDDYTVIATSPHIDMVSVLLGNNTYPLVARTNEWIEEASVSNTWQGMPTDWCWVAGMLRLYPTPDQSYPLTFAGTLRWPPLVSSIDANPWTDDAEQLIRCRAKAALFRHISRDPQQAQVMDSEEGRQLVLLMRETTRRLAGPVRLRVRSYF